MKELYKVVIVDDEAFAREALEFLVNWENLGFELVGTENRRWRLLRNTSRIWLLQT